MGATRYATVLATIECGMGEPKYSVANTVQGSTVPAKFQLKVSGGTVVQAATTPTFTRSASLGACDPQTGGETVDSDSGFTGSIFRWDGTAQQYIYNWSTKGLNAGEYRIFAVLDDGTSVDW